MEPLELQECWFIGSSVVFELVGYGVRYPALDRFITQFS